MLNDPVVIFVEESEDRSQVLGLLFEEMVEDVVFSPFDFLVTVQVVGFKQFFLDFGLLEIFEVLRIGGSLDVAGTFLNHLED